MKRPVVIGFGNPLRGDDGIGWRAAEFLETQGANAEIVACHQLTPELADLLGDAPLAIFLDASVAQAPGTVRVEPVAPAEYRGGSHHLTPSQLLGLAQRLKPRVGPAFLVSAGVLRIDYSDRPSALCEPCIARMAKLAIDLLEHASSTAVGS